MTTDARKRAKQSSPCVRIDPKTGQRTVISPRPHKVAAYAGAYGLWDDLCQTWRGGPFRSLTELTGALYDTADQPIVPMRYIGEYHPKPLSRTEMRQIKSLMEEAG